MHKNDMKRVLTELVKKQDMTIEDILLDICQDTMNSLSGFVKELYEHGVKLSETEGMDVIHLQFLMLQKMAMQCNGMIAELLSRAVNEDEQVMSAFNELLDVQNKEARRVLKEELLETRKYREKERANYERP